MKQFINYTYTFLPGASGVGYVDLTGIGSFNIRSLVAIINQTTGQLIYSTGSTVLKYTGVSGTKVFLNKDTTEMNAADKLQILYDPGEVASENTLNILSNKFTVENAGTGPTDVGIKMYPGAFYENYTIAANAQAYLNLYSDGYEKIYVSFDTVGFEVGTGLASIFSSNVNGGIIIKRINTQSGVCDLVSGSGLQYDTLGYLPYLYEIDAKTLYSGGYGSNSGSSAALTIFAGSLNMKVQVWYSYSSYSHPLTDSTGTPITAMPATQFDKVKTLYSPKVARVITTTNTTATTALTVGTKVVSIFARNSDAYINLTQGTGSASSSTQFIASGERLDFWVGDYASPYISVVFGPSAAAAILMVQELQ